MSCKNPKQLIDDLRGTPFRRNHSRNVGKEAGNPRSEGGVLFIEAALLLPPMFMFLMGMIAVGQVMLSKYQVAQAAAVVSRAVLDEPTMTDQTMSSVVVGAVNASTQLGGTPQVGARSFESTPPTIDQIKQLRIDSSASTVPTVSGGIKLLDNINCTTYPCWVAVTYQRTILPQSMFGKMIPMTYGSHAVVRIASSGPKSVVKFKEYRYRMIVNDWDDQDAGNPNFASGFTPELVPGLGKKIVQGQASTDLDAGDTDDAIILATPYTARTYSPARWGLRCKQGNGWVAVGCGMSTNGELFSSTRAGSTVDSDMQLLDNGCYTDQEELGAEAQLFIKCMKTEVQP